MSNQFGEPWTYRDLLREIESPGSRSRMLACVNACASMADPAAEIARMRDENAALRTACQRALKQFEHIADVGMMRAWPRMATVREELTAALDNPPANDAKGAQ